MLLIISKYIAEIFKMIFATADAILHCMIHQYRNKKSVVYMGHASEHPWRRTTYLSMQAHRYRVGAMLLLTAVLQVCSPTVFAQINLDYYAPRTSKGEIERFNNVQGFHLELGREYMAKGNYGAALGDFEFILRVYPNHPQALISLSELCLRWKSPICDSTAEQWFQKAIERNPGAAQSHVVQAVHLHRRSKLDDAVKSYKRALELAPNSLNAHYNLGLAYADLKQFELANQHAQKSYALGARLPGLRSRLEKAGKWNPSASLPVSEAEAKPAAEPSSPPSPEKAPD